MNRRGISIVELMATICFVLPVAALALGVADRLGRGQPDGDGRLVDLACLHLRRDAAAGVVVAPDALVAGGRRWRLEDGWLCRDDSQRLRVAAATWTQSGTIVSVRLRPHLLPERILELEIRP